MVSKRNDIQKHWLWDNFRMAKWTRFGIFDTSRKTSRWYLKMLWRTFIHLKLIILSNVQWNIECPPFSLTRTCVLLESSINHHLSFLLGKPGHIILSLFKGFVLESRPSNNHKRQATLDIRLTKGVILYISNSMKNLTSKCKYEH